METSTELIQFTMVMTEFGTNRMIVPSLMLPRRADARAALRRWYQRYADLDHWERRQLLEAIEQESIAAELVEAKEKRNGKGG